MRKSMVVLFAALALSGCGPTFRDPVEEYSYLRDLPNPTLTQWRRMQELADMEVDGPCSPGGVPEKFSVRTMYEGNRIFERISHLFPPSVSGKGFATPPRDEDGEDSPPPQGLRDGEPFH